MADVPQIVRDRLRRPAAGGQHPDANLLSAFAEQALTGPEREQMIEHLSRCAECREVVALSAPEVKEERLAAAVAAPSPGSAKRSWWRSPVVHWSALTAAALVVVIAVGERMRLREGQSASAPAVASYEAAPQSSAAAPTAAPAPSEPTESAKLTKAPKMPRRASAVGASKSINAFSAPGKAATLGGAPPAAFAQNAPPAPPPASRMRMKPSANSRGDMLSAFESRSEQGQAPAASVPSASETVSAAGASPATAPPQTAIVSERSEQPLAKRASLTPRWSISDSGAVQRSFDGGRSWKEVAVTDGITFRAVAVVLSDVWAGGTGGELFHSADAGEHWSRVRVEANGRVLSGDIIRIDFSDAQNGVMTTSTGETWTTSNAGADWQRH